MTVKYMLNTFHRTTLLVLALHDASICLEPGNTLIAPSTEAPLPFAPTNYRPG